MTTHSRAHRYLWTTIALTLMLGLLVYLVDGISGGERGLAAKRQLQHDIAGLKIQLTSLDGERAFLQKRVDALDPDNLDLDMLGEQARRVLFFAEPNEIVIKLPAPAN